MERQPLISVIMSVYNEERYIGEALRSILQQTQQDFEIIIFDDYSSDNTVKIIEEFHDDRIHIYRNTENRGLTKNLNQGLQLAKGRFIARMDGDDISLPRRFEIQLQYFEKHPDVFLISCQTKTFGAENLTWKLKDNPEKLKIMMLVRPVLAHPGYMMRRELVEFGFQYDESFRSAQDYDLAARVSRKYKIGIASPILLKYRAHEGQVSNKSGTTQFSNADRVREFLLKELDITLTSEEMDQYHKIVQEVKTTDMNDFISVRRILLKIIEANDISKLYSEKLLEETLLEVFYTWIVRNKSIKLYFKVWSISNGNLRELILFMKTFFNIIKQKA